MEDILLKKHTDLLERFLLLWILASAIGHCIFGLGIARICGTSMASTFDDGDYVLVAAVRDCRELQRGDVITFYATSGSRTAYVKRIVGLPGEIVEARGDLLFIDGKSDGISQNGTGTWGPVTVPPNAVFVLGDNRTVSIDSRILGSIPFQQVWTKVIGKGAILS